MAAPLALVVGSYNHDYAWRVERAPQAGQTLRGDAFRTAPGGKGFNQAVACARQGVPTAFIAAIGADAAGDGARRLAADEGIDAHWQTCTDAATGSACIVVEAHGQNRIIVALGANERLDPAFLREREALFAAAGVLLVQLENGVEATCAALDLAQAHGVLRVLNPAPVHDALDGTLLARCDLVTPNESEFALMLARTGGARIDADTLAGRDDAELHRLARGLGVPSVIVTLGAHGCFVSHEDARRHADARPYYRVAAEHADVVDTTGAGDAFSGALVAALLRGRGRPLRDAVVHANRCAALSTEHRGAAEAMPRAADVERRFGSGSSA
ncbi:ribokinase [Dokdonella fugitiva]|jgi:ribokinase|uniref:Ribokinase n=1 Tax=Dokdonella fugitiva TaxID=328517 RepID=A0A4R2IH81_9GAMM|nr:ribokinase [Dokdonella fugitiva]TCO43189.1 ribokinase [Dokdonella fugitiva]